MRGIIASSEFSGSESTLIMNGFNIDPIKLRQYVLYWDAIDFPTIPLMSTPLNADESYLQNVGILKRTKSILSQKESITIGANLIIALQIEAFNKNNEKGGIWSIAQPTKDVILPKDQSIKTRSLQVELYNCIPVPTEQVNLEDILNFKERRHNELDEFRWLLDRMYNDIISSGDEDLTKNMCMEKLQKKVIEINRVLDESNIKKCFRSMKARINIGDIGVLAAKIGFGALAGSYLGKPIEGTALSLLSSSINISKEISLMPKNIPDNLKDYAYLFHAHKELI